MAWKRWVCSRSNQLSERDFAQRPIEDDGAHVASIGSMGLGFYAPRKKCSKGYPEATVTANANGGDMSMHFDFMPPHRSI